MWPLSRPNPISRWTGHRGLYLETQSPWTQNPAYSCTPCFCFAIISVLWFLKCPTQCLGPTFPKIDSLVLSAFELETKTFPCLHLRPFSVPFQEKNFTVKLARLLHFWIQTNLKSQIHKRLILVTIEDNIFWPSVMSLSFHLYVCKRQFEQKEALWGDPNKNCHKHKSFRRHLVQPTHDKVRRDQLLIPCEWQRQMDFFSQFSVFGCCAYIDANYKGGIVCK